MDKAALWLTCFQNAPGTNSGDQMVQQVLGEPVQLQEVLQRESLRVDLAGNSVLRAGEREGFLVLLSERGCPEEIKKISRNQVIQGYPNLVRTLNKYSTALSGLL